MQFFVGPFLGIGGVNMEDWNAFVGNVEREGSFLYESVEVTHAGYARNMTLYGITLGVKYRPLVVGTDVQPYYVKRSLKMRSTSDPRDSISIVADLKGTFATLFFGLEYPMGPIDVSLLSRVSFGTSKVLYEYHYYGVDDPLSGEYVETSDAAAPLSVGGGFSLGVSYEVLPFLDVALQMGYDVMEFSPYSGDVLVSIYANNSETGETFTWDTTFSNLYWQITERQTDMGFLERVYSSSYISTVEDFSGFRVRLQVTFKLGGGR